MQECLPFNAIAVRIGHDEIAKCAPRADIAPTNGARHHGDLGRSLHDCVVDRVIRDLGKCRCIQLLLNDAFTLNLTGLLNAFLSLGENFGTMRRQGLQHGACLKAEHAGVPQEAARVHVFTRLLL